MNGRERGFLLLTSHLGDPQRRPLTQAQLRKLARRASGMAPPIQQRELEIKDIMALGYGPAEAQRIWALLSSQGELNRYLERGTKADCIVLTRISPGYPDILRMRLGSDCPGCLWAKGDLTLLGKPAVALVGSRDLLPENRAFAEEVGKQAARQGYVLISGNARGADKEAQKACLEEGGSVISIVADALEKHPLRNRVLYLSEDSFDAAFTATRALSRNRLIHCMGQKTFVAQCSFGTGGTWDGTVQNLRHRWNDVFCYADGSDAVDDLIRMGATGVDFSQLEDLSALTKDQQCLF